MDVQHQREPRIAYEGAAARKSLPLSLRDLHHLDRLRNSAARRAALAELVGTGDAEQLSEAQLLRAVFAAGLRAVDGRLEEESYAAEAVERQADDAERRAIARRRPPSWADEP